MTDLTPAEIQEKIQGLLNKIQQGIGVSEAELQFLNHHKDTNRWKRTLTEIAFHFKVKQQAMLRWQEKYPEAFKKTPIGYDLDAIKQARKDFLATGSYVRLNDGDEVNIEGIQDYATLKARKIHLECQSIEAKNNYFMGKTVAVDDVMTQFKTVIHVVKDKFRSMPRELAYKVSGVSPAEAEEIMNARMEEILHALSEEDYKRVEDTLRSAENKFEELGEKAPEKEKEKPKQAKTKKEK
jgi:DNA-binding MarR family transcriptional regulator